MTEQQPEQEQEWVTATALEEERTVFFRLLPEIPDGIATAEFSARIDIIWTYKSPNDSGMPGPNDREIMNQFEEHLITAWKKSGIGFLTMLITGNEISQWQWYLRDADESLQILNQALAEMPPLPIDIHTETDPDWYAYSNFMKQISS